MSAIHRAAEAAAGRLPVRGANAGYKAFPWALVIQVLTVAITEVLRRCDQTPERAVELARHRLPLAVERAEAAAWDAVKKEVAGPFWWVPFFGNRGRVLELHRDVTEALLAARPGDEDLVRAALAEAQAHN